MSPEDKEDQQRNHPDHGRVDLSQAAQDDHRLELNRVTEFSIVRPSRSFGAEPVQKGIMVRQDDESWRAYGSAWFACKRYQVGIHDHALNVDGLLLQMVRQGDGER